MSDSNTNEAKFQLASDIVKFLSDREKVDTVTVLSALSTVLATIAVEAQMEEEKAIYAFRKSFGEAQRKLKRIMKGVQ